jgi:threonine dehydrogenase-like Zn-dependent dehydrogenase
MNPYLAVLAEPLAVSVHAVMDRCPKLKEDDTVVVSGAGMIGLGVIATLKYVYPKTKVISLDTFEFKLTVAKAEGADETVCVKGLSESQILESVLPFCGKGRGGCDYFFECTGNPVSIANGLHLTRKRGTMVHVGLCKETEIVANWNHISAGKELNVFGSSLGHNCWNLALRILETGGALRSVVTHVYRLSDFKEALEKAFETATCIKVVIDPHANESKQVWDVMESVERGVPKVTWASEGVVGVKEE